MLNKFAVLGLTTATSAFELDWWSKCDFQKQDYERYSAFEKYAGMITDKQSCIKVRGKMFHVTDLDENFELDRCELAKGCFVQSKYTQIECLGKAAQWSTIDLTDVISACDEKFSKKAEDTDPKDVMELPKEDLSGSQFLTEEQASAIASLLPPSAATERLYYANEDGWGVDAYNSKVLGRGATLHVIKVAQTGKVFGFYTSNSMLNLSEWWFKDGRTYWLYYFDGSNIVKLNSVRTSGQAIEFGKDSEGQKMLWRLPMALRFYPNCNANCDSIAPFWDGGVWEMPHGSSGNYGQTQVIGEQSCGSNQEAFQCDSYEVYSVLG